MDLSYLTTYNEDALREIVYKNCGQYETVVVETAKSELDKRYQPFFPDGGDALLFADMIRHLNFEDFESFLKKYIRSRKDSLSAYRKVFEELSGMKPNGNGHVFLAIQKSADPDILDAVGTDKESGAELDLSFLTWPEWLSVRITNDQIVRIGPERIAALALYKMTVNGFDRNDTEKSLENLRTLAQTDFAPADEDESNDEDYDEDNDDSDDEGSDEDSEEGSDEDNDEDDDGDSGEVNGDGGGFRPVCHASDTDFVAQGLLQLKEDHKSRRRQETVQEVRPWVRYFARMFDYSLMGLIVDYAAVLLTGKTLSSVPWVKYVGVYSFLWILIEALLLASWGTTPGKFLLRITVRKSGGHKPAFSEAFYRSVMVWTAGVGCGIVLAEVITELASYMRLKQEGRTWYDEKCGYTVGHEKIGLPRALIFAALQIGMILLSVLLDKSSV